MTGIDTAQYILVMAGVTYLVRMLPMVVFRKKIRSRFIKSLLFYVPYAVLGAMTIPDIFRSTSSVISGAAGTVIAIILSLWNKSLITVALSACLTVYIVEWLLRLF